MMQSTFRLVAAAPILATLFACSNDRSPSEPEVKFVPTHSNALLDAPSVRQVAMSGAYVRGEQDKLVKIESRLLGFGGLYLDSAGTVVVFIKKSGRPTDAVVHQALNETFAARPERVIRQIMADVSSARIIEGQFTLSELIAVENRITANIGRIPGFSGVGVSLVANRVKLGFVDTVSLQRGTQSVIALGVPAEAIIPEVWGVPRTLAYWNSMVVPTRGGVEIQVINRSTHPYTPGTGSYGFNVTSNGVSYAITTAHLANDPLGRNGATGDTVFQPTTTGTKVGTVLYNPPWDTNCPLNTQTNKPYDFCLDADVAVISLFPGVLTERKIGTSDYAGVNGGSGSQHIHNYYPIDTVVPPEYILQHPTIGVHKSGFKTGTTTGVIDAAVTTQAVSGCMSYPQPPTGGTGPCGGAREYWALYRGVTRVAHMGGVGGDSGGPVFGGNGFPYHALGLVVAGLTGATDVNFCSIGSQCTIWFERWSAMENKLGFPLNPVTTQ